MNTVIASLFLVFVFTVNGISMDGAYPTSPLMFREGNQEPESGLKSIATSIRSTERTGANNVVDQTRSSSTTSSARDGTFSSAFTTSSNSSRQEETSLETARFAYEEALRAWQETSPLINSDDVEGELNNPLITIEDRKAEAMRLCLKKHQELNNQEAIAKVSLTPLPPDFSTPTEVFRYSPIFRPSSRRTQQLNATPTYPNNRPPSSLSGEAYQLSFPQSRSSDSHSSNSVGHFLTPPRSPLPTTAITSSARSRQGPNFYDSLHFVKSIPTIFGDTPVSAAAVTYFFTIDPRYAVHAWIFGNVLGSIVASHYVIRAIEARSPKCLRGGFKALLSPNEPLNYVWNPGYLAYYTVAWGIMGRDPTFNVTWKQAACFMLLSGAIRQIADQVINKKSCFSWNTKTWRPEARNPFSWEPENINAIASSPRSQYWRAFWEYLPDMIGAAARSGSSNIPGYLQGTENLHIIIPKVKKSTAVYTGGLAVYYGLYRGIELSLASRYKEIPEMNQRMLKRLYHNIQRAAKHGVSPSSDEGAPGPDITVSSHEELTPLLDSSNNRATPARATPARATPAGATPARATPTRNLSRSSSSKRFISHPISREALIASLKVLRSHLISYFKDPIFYRMEVPWKDAPAPFKQAYSIIDLLEMYKAHVTNEKTTSEKIVEASRTLLATLKSIRLSHQEVDTLILGKASYNGDLENSFFPDHQLETTHFHDILPLLYLFDRYAGTNPHKAKPPQAAELTPLRASENRNGYGATHAENKDEAPIDDDLFSDDSDLDEGWAPR